MIERFTATEVELEPLAGFIGFVDSVNKRYFWMQPGEDGPAKSDIWLERDDQCWGGTGDKWSIILRPSQFAIDTSALPWMACDAIEINYQVDEIKLGQLKELLRRAMAACLADLKILEHSGSDA